MKTPPFLGEDLHFKFKGPNKNGGPPPLPQRVSSTFVRSLGFEKFFT